MIKVVFDNCQWRSITCSHFMNFVKHRFCPFTFTFLRTLNANKHNFFLVQVKFQYFSASWDSDEHGHHPLQGECPHPGGLKMQTLMMTVNLLQLFSVCENLPQKQEDKEGAVAPDSSPRVARNNYFFLLVDISENKSCVRFFCLIRNSSSSSSWSSWSLSARCWSAWIKEREVGVWDVFIVHLHGVYLDSLLRRSKDEYDCLFVCLFRFLPPVPIWEEPDPSASRDQLLIHVDAQASSVWTPHFSSGKFLVF